METQTHHKIFYTLHGMTAGAVVGAAIVGAIWLSRKPSLDEVPRVYHASAADLAAVPWGNHLYTVFASPGSGDFPEEIADAILATLHVAKVEPTLDPHEGNWVSPDTPDGRAVANALSKIVGEKVGVYDHGGAFEISVGVPIHKKDAN